MARSAPGVSSPAVDALAFEHHLTSPQGLDRLPRDGFQASAGGAACCDEIEIGLALAGDRIEQVGFRAHGCGSVTAAGSAAVTLIRDRTLFDAARIGPAAIAGELGGLSPAKEHAAELAADALARALGRAARASGAVGRPSTSRTLVAMSGGVDSAVAALLCARDSETVAVTLELWADPENDGERSCCSASAVAQARRSHTTWASPISRSICAPSSGPVSSTRSSPGSRRARPPTRASVVTGTSGSTRCSRSPSGSDARRSRPAITPGSPRPTIRGARCFAPPWTRQGPDLHAGRA